MLGYWQDAAATEAKIQNGWLCTGDLAEQLDDGSIRILGRADDQISLSTGYKVSPLELTRRLSAEAWLDQVVLVGENQPHVGALVYPRLELLPREFIDDSTGQLHAQPFLAALRERLRPMCADLPRYMQLERFALLPQPLSVENGGLNFKGAIRRAFVESTLHPQIVNQLFLTKIE